MIITSISDDKNTIVIGDNVFEFVEEERLKSSCLKCAFSTTDDCSIIPCMPVLRQPVDRKEGYFEQIK